jgi:HD superfamily phosphohydrolase
MLNSQGIGREKDTLKFNNFLNRLGMKKIYAFLIICLLILVLAIYLIVRTVFYVAPADKVLANYIDSLQKQNFHQASRLVLEEQQDEWSDLYEAMAQDDSALQTLYFYLWSKSSVEFVSQSNMDPKHKVLRIQVEAPDAYKILEEVRTEAEQGQIDLSDPDVVRPAVDQKSALYYYVIDHYDMLETPLRQEEVVVNMYLEGNFNTRAWRIDTSQELHDILAGNVKEAGQKVFAKPLDVPKS